MAEKSDGSEHRQLSKAPSSESGSNPVLASSPATVEELREAVFTRLRQSEESLLQLIENFTHPENRRISWWRPTGGPS